MILRAITILIAVLTVGVLTPARADVLDPLFNSDVRVVTRLHRIDPGVLAALKQCFKSDHRLADRGAPFSAGDAMLPGQNPPSRRLVLAAVAQNIWFIHYEHGGIGLHSHLVAFIRSGHSWRLAYSASGFYGYPTLDKLREAVREHRFTPSDSEY